MEASSDLSKSNFGGVVDRKALLECVQERTGKLKLESVNVGSVFKEKWGAN